MFLDDLQWADDASLALLQPLLTSPEIGHLCLIGSLRESELAGGHPLTATLAALEAARVRVDRVVLEPLGLADLEHFVGDCLHRHDGETRAQARLVAEKTAGNPFFVIQFLKRSGGTATCSSTRSGPPGPSRWTRSSAPP